MNGNDEARGARATIVAPSTPPGRGAVAIVRLSGPEAHPIAGRLAGIDPASLPPRTLVRCAVRDAAGAPIDDGLLVLFRAPGSFTGEDVAELHLHGNAFLVERALAGACALGAVPAAPGEFSRRAFENGTMDLTQAEGLADLIAARTEGAVRAAVRQLRGGLEKATAGVREKLVALQTLLEASIDFSDEEDVGVQSGPEVAERISEIRTDLGRILASYARGHRFRDGAVAAIAGVANVGKSSLLNRIVGEERAIVAELPGTTRDYLTAEIDLAGVPIRLVDTAGLREAGDPVEEEGVRRSRRIISDADLTLFLLDRSRPAGGADRAAYVEVEERDHIIVLNKSDLPPAETGEHFRGPGLKGVVSVSAKTGEGVDALMAALSSGWGPKEEGARSEAPLTRARHAEAVRKGMEALARAQGAAGGGFPAECVAADVREASRALAELFGEISPEELLDGIFSSFCIGK